MTEYVNPTCPPLYPGCGGSLFLGDVRHLHSPHLSVGKYVFPSRRSTSVLLVCSVFSNWNLTIAGCWRQSLCPAHFVLLLYCYGMNYIYVAHVAMYGKNLLSIGAIMPWNIWLACVSQTFSSLPCRCSPSTKTDQRRFPSPRRPVGAWSIPGLQSAPRLSSVKQSQSEQKIIRS